jgi:hypothetical protein
MTLRMADGPVANLPPGMDAYAGYVNASGIGTTYPAVQVLAAREKAIAFSITTNGSPAQCADVEAGAMSTWKGYRYGYCAVSNVNALIASQGRPAKLWTSHYDPKIGKHICSPECWPGLVTTADGTQWVDHGGWDESELSDDFFAPPSTKENDTVTSIEVGGQLHVFGLIGSTAYHWWQNSGTSTWNVEALPV